jgi:polyhydroxyalkanoate synthesis regulator phasin
MLTSRRFLLLAICVAFALAAAPPARADEARSLDELRNTVINLLDALVQKGVMTKEQAQQMVSAAQAKAEREAQDRATANADAETAVRVTYVPQVVRDEISAQVSEQVRPQVVKDVVAQAQSEQWGVPAALPAWIKDLELYGDIRVRQQYDGFASDNAEFAYLDFLRVNQRGGIGRAGTAAFLNTTEDRMRTRVRARFGLEADLGDNFAAGLRLATGNFTDPVSTNQTLAQMSGRYTFGVEQAYLRYDATRDGDWSWLSFTGGRMANPFHSTDLVFDNDLTFEGFAGTYRHALTAGKRADHNLFATIGAFPLEEVELSSDDKWLYAAQFGGVWRTDGGIRLKGSLSYYHYENIVGVRNAFGSTLTDFTAPAFLQKGNTLFDIRNDADPSTNLFALAADYHLADVLLSVDLPVFDDYQLAFAAEYVANLGFDRADVAARTGIAVDERTDGYMFEVGFGHPRLDRVHAWRASMRYRYLQRDAVLDAFTDSDFHLGGTDAQGYVLRGDYGLGRNVYLSFRYLSANEIDGPPLGIDVVQLDLNGQF